MPNVVKNKNKNKKREDRSFKSYGAISNSLTYLQGKEKKKRTEKIFENIIAENFSKLIEDNKTQIQPAQKISSRIKILPRHIIIKSQDKEKILKSSRNKKTYYIQRNNDRNYNKLLIIIYHTEDNGVIILTEVSNIMEQRQAMTTSPCPNSSTKEPLSIINDCFTPLLSRGNLVNSGLHTPTSTFVSSILIPEWTFRNTNLIMFFPLWSKNSHQLQFALRENQNFLTGSSKSSLTWSLLTDPVSPLSIPPHTFCSSHIKLQEIS